jgi:hypothetical protein
MRVLVVEDDRKVASFVVQGLHEGNRSASENLTLAIRSPCGIPCPHGNPTCIMPRGLGTDSL